MSAEFGFGKSVAALTSSFGCAACPAREHNLCEALKSDERPSVDAERVFIPQYSRTIKARRLIVHEQDFHDAVPIICSGWAATIKLLPDGRRQILSILLPGDVVSTGLLFGPKPEHTIEAITDVHYRTFKRHELRDILFKRNEFLDSALNAWLAEQVSADRLIVDLGRRSGEERIARLILGVAQRLKERDMMRDATSMDFPLRQHHIADATGLTQVHVSGVISDFRRSRLVEFRQRSLTLLDLEGLRRRGNLTARPVRAKPVFYALPAM
jgi:CRP/FNR family transcriptional regulator, anaerobic regulatory protein